jgi:hypothetical protein
MLSSGLLLSLISMAAALAPLPMLSRPRPTVRFPRIYCGPRVRIVSVGKTKEAWLESAIELYTTRLRGVIEIECDWVRDDTALLKSVVS